MKKKKLALSKKLILGKELISSLGQAHASRIVAGAGLKKTNDTNCPYTQQYQDCITHRMAECPSVLCTVPEDNVSLCTQCGPTWPPQCSVALRCVGQ